MTREEDNIRAYDAQTAFHIHTCKRTRKISVHREVRAAGPAGHVSGLGLPRVSETIATGGTSILLAASRIFVHGTTYIHGNLGAGDAEYVCTYSMLVLRRNVCCALPPRLLMPVNVRGHISPTIYDISKVMLATGHGHVITNCKFRLHPSQLFSCVCFAKFPELPSAPSCRARASLRH